MNHLYLLPFFSIFFLLGDAHAQPGPSSEKADSFYENLGFQEAIELYQSGQLDLRAMKRMAEAYRLNHDTENAEKWYAEIIIADPAPENLLHYAQALQSNGKLEAAKSYFLKYDESASGNADQRGRRFAKAIEEMEGWKKNSDVAVENAAILNSEWLDFSPFFWENGLAFVSNRPAGNAGKKRKSTDRWTGGQFSDLYFAPQKTEGGFGPPSLFSENLSGQYHEGPLCFFPGGNEMLFTRSHTSEKADAERRLHIFSAQRKRGEWSEATPLDLTDSGANNAHPALSPDGLMLFFASDRAGGYGGMDIYRCRFSFGKWGAPVNLGPSVNTAGNELFPFVHADGTLFFASDGWGGLGGLDLFFTDTENFGEAENMGTPFNSPKDDFGLAMNGAGTGGYFTSARIGGKGKDDLYRFSLPAPFSEIKSGDKTAVFHIVSRADGKAVEGAAVIVFLEKSKNRFEAIWRGEKWMLSPIGPPGEYAFSSQKRDPFGGHEDLPKSGESDGEGFFHLPLSASEKYIFWVKKAGYQELIHEFEIPEGVLEKTFSLVPDGRLELNGTVTEWGHDLLLPGAEVSLLNLCSGETVSLKSDENGRFGFALPCGCDFVLTGTKQGFFSESQLVSLTEVDCLIHAGGAGISQKLKLRKRVPSKKALPISNDENLTDGFVIELEEVFYDFDEAAIRPDAAAALDEVVDFMERNPRLHLEMRSHTDSRGNDDYNRKLSARRAKAAADFVVKRGIEPHRISAIGFGKDALLNNCSDCSKVDHQMNRRTEIRIFLINDK